MMGFGWRGEGEEEEENETRKNKLNIPRIVESSERWRNPGQLSATVLSEEPEIQKLNTLSVFELFKHPLRILHLCYESCWSTRWSVCGEKTKGQRWTSGWISTEITKDLDNQPSSILTLWLMFTEQLTYTNRGQTFRGMTNSRVTSTCRCVRRKVFLLVYS